MEAQAAIEENLSGAVAGTLFRCPQATTGVVVLGGSSARVDVGRARLFANEGSSALALQWFGGEGQPPGICEIPLETFFAATDCLLETGCHRIVYVGTSKGAEASLLAAVHDPRIDAVVAISPSSVIWGNIGAGRDGVSWPERSSWSLDGIPLPFVPTDPNWTPEYVDGLVSYRGLFEHCLKTSRQEAAAATIPVETASAEILLVAGGDDALWPSLWFATEIVRRRSEAGKITHLVSSPDAGHRILLPGENTPRSTLHAHGGNDEAESRLGRMAWEGIRELL
ncbi:acyl-CoA thioesterase [Mesorhizobium sp. M7A.F.Ca.CA.001.09.2.1]|uniref:Acyl-CoA thioesterase n=2 Tax=Mesorhizobium TaxID=68287 RepID=A0AB38T9M3_9HYPH|nr:MULTISPECIES: acyl-CoA thioester hydrolase/BAAT C-terminal domain-containing protein [Mesorhizobium]MDF3213971.1 acyl-CoA thioester hydrolase/BAAT C-terminal domain-containing protein [Mesorhizobium ciceri]RUY61990.1 acyl-CoA thioesterase [Mesorhizobium sp. M7A.F.Ca.CA.001.05.1.1]RUY68988.1 acyl-CoA thioesterase [Mesorhizobium sp. M7A.F.Ca.CA.001.13.1.1]RUY73543.1 acyl-CoA thioesterase [Mesorhizobium sp. M7A.F.Ca.CA.001.09.2.1]RUZ08524.1 acyl-CoA thioesterase [Mesorhizobium sp. M7A.F.Ca.CA.